MMNYPLIHSFEVIFRDIDWLGHVNNSVYFTYFETGRIKYYAQVFQRQDINVFPSVVVEATCTFKAPAYLGDTLHMGVGLSRFGNSSFDMHYRIENAQGRLLALAKTVSVFIDPQTERSIPIPEQIKILTQAYQGAWQLPES